MNQNSDADQVIKSARKVRNILDRADPIIRRNNIGRTKFNQMDVSAYTYSSLLVLFQGNNEVVNSFIARAIGPYDVQFQALFEQMIILGYAAALLDTTDKRIKITR